MKKIIAAAAGLMLVGSAMATTASAVENKFGGYWRMRGFSQIDFDGTDSGTYSRADSRTRLYYTAIFNENFKFVNKFEMDAIYGGDKSGYGDVGADGIKVEVKNTYADFKLGGSRWKVGTQGNTISRGFIFADDHSGIYVDFDAGGVKIPLLWVAVDTDIAKTKENTRDYYAVMPVFNAGEGVTVQPLFLYDNNEGTDGWDNYYLGVDVDVKMDAASFWGSAIYNFGEITVAGDQDISAFLIAAGASSGPVHGQIFYATGDDDPTDGDFEAFVTPTGASYYWSEIMGYGIIDNTSPIDGLALGDLDGDNITNIWAANIGFKVKPMDKLTLTGDLWYAELAEAIGDTDLGFEIDVKATYAIMDNLKLDLVAAYLVAGDALGDEDPIELGARLSLSF